MQNAVKSSDWSSIELKINQFTGLSFFTALEASSYNRYQ